MKNITPEAVKSIVKNAKYTLQIYPIVTLCYCRNIFSRTPLPSNLDMNICIESIQYNTGGCPAAAAAVCVGHKFYIQLALPISPSIMDGF